MEHYIIKMEIIRYYLLPKSTELKEGNQKSNYISASKI